MPLSYEVKDHVVEDCCVRAKFEITFDDGTVQSVENTFIGDVMSGGARAVYDEFVNTQARNYADLQAKKAEKADKEAELKKIVDKVALNEKITL